MSLTPLTCIGLDGTARIFYCEVESKQDPDGSTWRYRIHLRNPPEINIDDFYEAEFIQIGETRVRVATLDRHQEHYGGKGITEAVFSDIVLRTSLQLVSSTNKNGSDEFRTEAATRVWDRLVEKEKALYEPESGRYILL